MSFCIAINQNVIIGIKIIKSRCVWAKRYIMCAGNQIVYNIMTENFKHLYSYEF